VLHYSAEHHHLVQYMSRVYTHTELAMLHCQCTWGAARAQGHYDCSTTLLACTHLLTLLLSRHAYTHTTVAGVTLGGTGKDRGDRHPKLGSGILIGAGALILGNIRIGDGCKIAAGSVVLMSLPGMLVHSLRL
jgi:acetyltransferase-like isoleucine patch superfamily enzyme